MWKPRAAVGSIPARDSSMRNSSERNVLYRLLRLKATLTVEGTINGQHRGRSLIAIESSASVLKQGDAVGSIPTGLIVQFSDRTQLAMTPSDTGRASSN